MAPVGISSVPVAAPATAVLDRPDPENLFVPLVAPAYLVTPGLGHAFGEGRRKTWLRRAGTGDDAVELIVESSPPAGSAATEDVQLARAVDEVFAEVKVSRLPTAELIRPYIEHFDDASVWAGVGIVPPPTPVLGIGGPPIQVKPGVVGGPAGGLPSRRELREQRKAEESARSAATRRLAKGGVLALTMFGVVASQAPQALHQRLFGAPATTSDNAATSIAVPATVYVDTSALPRDGVEETLRLQLIKKDQIQRVSDAAQDAGGVLVAVAQAQAANDKAVREAALARATREGQRNPKALAQIMVAERGWSSEQFTCLDLLWTRESRWNYRATNPSSGAYGIPQSLPGSKMASAGSDWRNNPATQIKWGMGYIADRYGTPCAAWQHSEQRNWY